MRVDWQPDIKKALAKLLRGPACPEKEFIRSGATFGKIYAMAARLHAALDKPEYKNTAVCLAADSKAVMAASLLAALGGGPPLLLPYAFSSRALKRLHQATGFTAAISDGARGFPQGVQVLCPENLGSKTRLPTSRISPQAVLLKIFTGGSTGTPQLWTKTGENLFSEGFFLASRFAVTKQDCIMATIPPYHIYGLLFSVILPLVASASVVDETPSFPGEITSVAKKQQATIMASVPAHYRVLRDSRKDMSLRLAFSSAGMLDAADNETFCRNNKTGVIEVYGSTETGGIALRKRSAGEECFTPFPTIDWKVVQGRLAVRSPYISPDLPVDADGFFIAGDRIAAREDGGFSLEGRADTVTKVGGKRVDLEEIRLLIKKEPGVSDCAVVAVPEAGGREHRIGALIEGGRADTDRIKKILADSLEPYALPRHMKKVDRIPVQKNGKYDLASIRALLDNE